MVLHYTFGKDAEIDFEYEVDADFSDYLEEYLENNYVSVEEAIKDLFSESDKEDWKRAASCKTFHEIAAVMNDIDSDWGEDLISTDDSFVDSIYDDLKEENEEAALEAYNEESDGCDPDGFYGWDDYYRWKNGSDCFNK